MLVNAAKTLNTLPKGTAGFLIYTLCLLLGALMLPPIVFDPASKKFILIVGALAIWRYSWGLLHFIRHWIYRKVTFPKIRKKIDDNTDALMPSHIYLLVTSFRIEVDTTIQVFKSVISEAITCGVPTTIVASIVERGDESLIKSLFEGANPPPEVKLSIVRIPGTGKRDGLAQAFRAISRAMPPSDAVVAVIDGDSILEPGLIQKCAPLFNLDPKVGSLTTDELCEVRGSRIMKEWHHLRFIQRQITMCSTALSHQILTLTGRMSMFRAEIITNPDFIAQIQNDSLNHWRLGRFKFLTGDDKSSWYWVLKNGWNMLYVPDATVTTIEHPPHPNFFRASTQLMFRWFGNMLRTNGRALKLNPLKIGLFPWWCILDQRIAMWTSLTGPVFALMLCFSGGLSILPVFILWIGFTRWVMTLMLFTARGTLSWYYPFLIYYNQTWGAVIKTFVFFRLDRQSWTRQKTKLNRSLSPLQERYTALSSNISYGVAMTCFIFAIGLIAGVFDLPKIL